MDTNLIDSCREANYGEADKSQNDVSGGELKALNKSNNSSNNNDSQQLVGLR